MREEARSGLRERGGSLAGLARTDTRLLDGQRYPTQVAENTNYGKFDDTRSMVLDVTRKELRAIEQLLEAKQAEGELVGVHASVAALMTCIVRRYEGPAREPGGRVARTTATDEGFVKNREGGDPSRHALLERFCMVSGKALLGSVFGRFLFKTAEVVDKREHSTHFVSLRLRGDDLCGVEWEPGDKAQVFLPGVGTRTYTPLSWDIRAGTTTFLIYAKGVGPGASWARSVGVGDRLQFHGPSRSLVAGDAARTVLFGDETSFGVAHALVHRRPQLPLRCVFEVSERREAAAVLSEYGLSSASLVERTHDETHLEDAHERIRGLLGGSADAKLVMTGRAQAIQLLQRRLRNDRMPRPSQVKAYWSLGKRGLD